jgi:hypothetical protein
MKYADLLKKQGFSCFLIKKSAIILYCDFYWINTFVDPKQYSLTRTTAVSKKVVLCQYARGYFPCADNDCR